MNPTILRLWAQVSYQGSTLLLVLSPSAKLLELIVNLKLSQHMNGRISDFTSQLELL